MKLTKKITVVIPCHNEEKGIGKVIDNIPVSKLASMGYETEILVVDNNSSDRTAKIAKEKGARVLTEYKKGKGNALRNGFRNLTPNTTYVVMLDGDNTYRGSEILRMIEPLESNFADVVVGSRLGGKLKKNSLKLENRMANWTYTFLVRHFYHANTTDVLSGYFAWKKKVVDQLLPHIESDGFAVEMEMITKMTRFKHDICSVPITYDEREGETKVEAIRDGIIILSMFLKNLFWQPSSKKPLSTKVHLHSSIEF